eukprot:29852-Prymnesium_polylepis.2
MGSRPLGIDLELLTTRPVTPRTQLCESRANHLAVRDRVHTCARTERISTGAANGGFSEELGVASTSRDGGYQSTHWSG